MFELVICIFLFLSRVFLFFTCFFFIFHVFDIPLDSSNKLQAEINNDNQEHKDNMQTKN